MPVYRRLVCDSLTPVSAFHKIDSGRCACLFESVVGGEKVGRYSFLAADPFFEIEAYGHRVTTNAYSRRFGLRRPAGDALVRVRPIRMAELRRHVEALRAVHLPELPPFCSGAVGYAGYDTVRYFERLPKAPPDDRQVPDLAFAFYDRMVVFDNVAKTIVVVAMARLDRPGATVESAYDDARRRVDALVEQLATRSADLRSGRYPARAARCSWSTARISRQPQFEKAVREVRGVHPRRRHLPGRAQPAAGGAADGPSRSRSTARCGWSTPARSCSTSARPA